MIRTLPSWYGKVEDELRRTINLLANKENIRWRFVNDSKLIDESVNNIMSVLLRLKEEVVGELDEETIKEFKKFEEVVEKEKQDKSKREKGSKKKQLKSRKQNKTKS